MVTNFNVLAFEGDHVFDPSYARKMRLPFHEGWEGWLVMQGEVIIMQTTRFELAMSTCFALNNMEYLL